MLFKWEQNWSRFYDVNNVLEKHITYRSDFLVWKSLQITITHENLRL